MNGARSDQHTRQTAAYAIMRHRGVPLQKGDFMGA